MRQLYSALEVCDLFLGNSDNEMEMEVADEEHEEEEGLDVEERIAVEGGAEDFIHDQLAESHDYRCCLVNLRCTFHSSCKSGWNK